MILVTDGPTYVLNNRVLNRDSAQGVIEQPRPGWAYGHYKGGSYVVLAIGKHTETQEDIVFMRNVKHGSYSARPLSVWNEYATGQDGYEYKRFIPTYQVWIVNTDLDKDLDEAVIDAAADKFGGYKN